MARTHSARFVCAVAVGMLAAGCGSSARSADGARQAPATDPGGLAAPAPGSGPQAIPAPGPTGLPAGRAAVSVIRGWSESLRRGDVKSAAGYFALPSRMINGADARGRAVVLPITTRAQAEAADATLSCGARLISADQRGPYVNALFRLTDRPGGGGGCGAGSGQTARTNFIIAGGRIAAWIRAPDDPSDNHGPGAPRSPTPSTSPSAGPAV